MKIFNLKPELSANDLIAHGIRVEMDCSNEKMRLIISDKNLIKFKCNLIEEDYPKEFPESDSILEFNLKKLLKNLDLPFGHFTTEQSVTSSQKIGAL
jgi:hypothetical protein